MKKFMAMLLTLVMVLSLLPGTALAVNDSSAPAVTYADLADINGTALVPDGAGENTELTVADAVRALLLWTGMTEQQLGSFPVFVKPCSQGSSVGVAKANNMLELAEGLTEAFRMDSKVLVEEFIDGQEVECAAIGNPDDPSTVSTTRPGEILAGAEFYTYDDKYKNGVSQTVIPAHLSEEKLDEVRAEARKAYLALGCSGLSRCDFFVERGTGRVLCNELNTLPGFTSISMYPKLMEHEGYSYPALVDKLLTLAVHRRKGAY